MPKFRLSEVIEQNSVDLSKLSPEIRDAIDRLIAQPDKLNAKTAEDLRAISTALKISIFDLLPSLSKTGCRLKILEKLSIRFPHESLDINRIERFHQDIKSTTSINVPIPTLVLYATHAFPLFIFNNKKIREIHINPIYQTLDVDLESLKENIELPNYSLDSLFISNIYKYDISIEELSLISEVHPILLPWISKSTSNNTTLETFSLDLQCALCAATQNAMSCFLCRNV
ncbi:MAG: hypothetical protein LH649_01960 [Pseudanabaena sp. CAN_BIN31]|nr:hypothetical protein [Pseudanabaena sp. CAN_BIN31]